MRLDESGTGDGLPCNLDAERQVLGALIVFGERVPEIAELLSAGDFYSRRHQWLFECLVDLSNRGLPINFVSVGEALLTPGRFQAVGGNEYLLELGQGVTSAAHLAHHASIVAQHARRRRGIRVAEDLAADLREAPSDDPGAVDDLLEAREQALRSLREGHGARAGSGLVVRAFSTIERKPLRWLWPGRFPLGKLSLVCGNPKRGKSLLLIDVAARVSRGLGWPDAPDDRAKPRDVFILSAEDDAADTVRPRLEAAGADLDRVVWVDAVREKGRLRPINLEADLARMEREMGTRPDSALWIIDPLTAYLGARDSHKDAEIRGLLSPVAQFAARTGVAIAGIMHLRKGSADHAAYRVSGSIAFTAAARSSLLVADDPERPDRRLLLPLGGNLAPDAQGLAFSISPSPDDSSVPIIAWEPEPVAITPEQALAPREPEGPPTARGEAKDWLRAQLAGGPVASGELEKRAKRDGLSWTGAVRRAADELRVGKEKGTGSADAPWFWWLHDPASREARSSSSSCSGSAPAPGCPPAQGQEPGTWQAEQVEQPERACMDGGDLWPGPAHQPNPCTKKAEASAGTFEH